MRFLFNFVLRLLVILAVIALLTGIWIVADGLNDQTQPTDIAVVLGHAVLTNGQPGPVLKERLDVAIKQFQQNKFPYIVVSGASRPGGYNEAAGMAAYLINQGVPRESILEDAEGDNTAATARNLAALMHQRHLHTVTIITHYYHITRTKMLLRENGVTQTQQVHAGLVQLTWRSARNLCREILALYYYLGRYYIPILQEKVESHLHSQVS